MILSIFYRSRFCLEYFITITVFEIHRNFTVACDEVNVEDK